MVPIQTDYLGQFLRFWFGDELTFTLSEKDCDAREYIFLIRKGRFIANRVTVEELSLLVSLLLL